MFKHVVTTESELRELIGSPSERAIKKDVAVLDAHCRDFIARSPFLLLATASARGRCDVSPKGDVPGFGMIFLIPGREETLRVNGRASIIRDAEILESLTAHGKRPLVAIGLEVEECFFHCPKAFRRSELWNPERWLDRAALPSMARVLFEQIRPAGKTVEEYERESEEGLKRTLY